VVFHQLAQSVFVEGRNAERGGYKHCKTPPMWFPRLLLHKPIESNYFSRFRVSFMALRWTDNISLIVICQNG
jgi:hypothetical protein